MNATNTTNHGKICGKTCNQNLYSFQTFFFWNPFHNLRKKRNLQSNLLQWLLPLDPRGAQASSVFWRVFWRRRGKSSHLQNGERFWFDAPNIEGHRVDKTNNASTPEAISSASLLRKSGFDIERFQSDGLLDMDVLRVEKFVYDKRLTLHCLAGARGFHVW